MAANYWTLVETPPYSNSKDMARLLSGHMSHAQDIKQFAGSLRKGETAVKTRVLFF
jgi:hypothetical protein